MITRLAHECRAFKGWDDQNPGPNETSVALRIPLGLAQGEVHRSTRRHTHLPQTLGMWLDGLITRAHVRKMLSATSRPGQEKCARGWHNAKTHLGFKVKRRADGSIIWTTPLGQTYTAYPYDYRLGP